MNRIRELRGGAESDATFGSRMTGQGIFADLVAQRFRHACRACGLDEDSRPLETMLFRPPRAGGQIELF
jgi:hypothetical protein